MLDKRNLTAVFLLLEPRQPVAVCLNARDDIVEAVTVHVIDIHLRAAVAEVHRVLDPIATRGLFPPRLGFQHVRFTVAIHIAEAHAVREALPTDLGSDRVPRPRFRGITPIRRSVAERTARVGNNLRLAIARDVAPLRRFIVHHIEDLVPRPMLRAIARLLAFGILEPRSVRAGETVNQNVIPAVLVEVVGERKEIVRVSVVLPKRALKARHRDLRNLAELERLLPRIILMPHFEVRPFPPIRTRHHVHFPVVIEVPNVRAFAPELIAQLNFLPRMDAKVSGDCGVEEVSERQSSGQGERNLGHAKDLAERRAGSKHAEEQLRWAGSSLLARRISRDDKSSVSCSMGEAKQLPKSACMCWSIAALLAMASANGFAETPVSFRNDVIPVLSKAGCSLGTCHGNKYGKGGFKLSLRSQDPDLDLLALTRDAAARRVNEMEPDRSLMLLKPTTQVPHEGGLRFKKDSDEYRILRDWIAQGCRDDAETAPKLARIEVSPREQVLTEPKREVQLSAKASFSDGSSRDITSVAVYEPANTLVKVSHDGLVQSDGNGETTVLVRFLGEQLPVRLAFIPARSNFKWTAPHENNYIDKHVFAKLHSLRMNPSELCSDTVFMRRAYLDLLGILPTADEARAFLADQRKDKRVRLIDELLERPEFADFWALKWADLFRSEEKAIDRKGVQAFHDWIAQGLRENKPVDQFVREVIAARGSTYLNPPANYYRAP